MKTPVNKRMAQLIGHAGTCKDLIGIPANKRMAELIRYAGTCKNLIGVDELRKLRR